MKGLVWGLFGLLAALWSLFAWLLHGIAGTRYSGWDYPVPPDSLMEVELLYGTLAGEFGEERLADFREMRAYLEPLLADLMEGMR